ncbi:MAG: hypothetical protein R3F56_20065 [Planctomycetota bacterium]
MRALGVLVPSLLAWTTVLPAQTPSGPEAGSDLGKAQVYAPTGARAGTTFDAAAVIGQGPGALLFVGELNRNVAPLVRGLDRLAAAHGLQGFHACTVLLASDRTAAEQQVERASPALALTYPMVVSVDGVDGPGSYGLDRKCTATLVLADKGKVVRSVGYTDTGAQDVPQLAGWVTAMTGPLPEDVGGTRALLARKYPNADGELLDLTAALLVQTRRQAARETTRMGGANDRRGAPPDRRPPVAGADAPDRERARAGKAPDDPELRKLLRAIVQQSATEQDLDAAFRDIDARVGSDADLERQAVAMFELVASRGYGSEAAQKRCAAYVDAHQKTDPGK